jgi:thiol-disulfide isomerase/thioredoxin
MPRIAKASKKRIAKSNKKVPKKTKSNKPKKTVKPKIDKVKIDKQKEALNNLKILREKLVKLKRQNHPHLGNNTLIQPMQPKYFKEQDLSEEAPRKNGVVLFYANWCPHCHHVMPIMNELADSMYNNNMEDSMVGAIDCAEPQHDNISDQMGIMGYPTIKVYNKGHYIGDYEGPRDTPFMMSVIKKMMEQN